MPTLLTTIHAANAVLIADGKLDRVGEFFTPDYIAHFTGGDMTGGHKAIQAVLGKIRQAFPDVQLDIDILVEGADRVAWQRTLTGTQTGAFKGFPASGRRLVWRDMVTSRFRDGLIAEEWVVTDLAEQLMLSRKARHTP